MSSGGGTCPGKGKGAGSSGGKGKRGRKGKKGIGKGKLGKEKGKFGKGKGKFGKGKGKGKGGKKGGGGGRFSGGNSFYVAGEGDGAQDNDGSTLWDSWDYSWWSGEEDQYYWSDWPEQQEQYQASAEGEAYYSQSDEWGLDWDSWEWDDSCDDQSGLVDEAGTEHYFYSVEDGSWQSGFYRYSEDRDCYEFEVNSADFTEMNFASVIWDEWCHPYDPSIELQETPPIEKTERVAQSAPSVAESGSTAPALGPILEEPDFSTAAMAAWEAAHPENRGEPYQWLPVLRVPKIFGDS